MSSHLAGSSFEARVAQLLRSSPGYKNVREQQHIRGMNVDIIFEKQWNPHRYLTIGVECKNWAKGLDRKALKSIYFDYETLLKKGDIDELWIVTPRPVGATLQEHVNKNDKLVLLHISELEQDIINFSIYAKYLNDRFARDPLAKYYIPSRVEPGSDTLHSEVSKWLESDSGSPIAIWAGYGMGKTSYASFLASELADKFLEDPTNRIPIFIPLGDYYTAPRLDGLFASVLTGDNGVYGYNFNTFWNLHEAGRFVVILDGFDEMKHAMSRAEFSAISREIRKLVIPNSKVLLLGRPDAIISGEEHRELVRGSRKAGSVDMPDEIGVTFTEFRIEFFKRDEYQSFLENYIKTYYRGKGKESYAKKRISDIADLDLDDILRRPVQARMLAQILLNPAKSITALSKYELYNVFIEECLNYESGKPERRKTDNDLRRRFMQDLAWWLWAFKRTRTFTVDEIPAELRKAYISETTNDIGQLREFMVGSVVEERSVGSLLNEKAAGTFYFPHLSFTEFLVAEYLIERALTEQDVSVLADSIGGEVKSFIRSYKGGDALYILFGKIGAVLRDHSWKLKTGISLEVLLLIAESPTLRKDAAVIAQRPLTFGVERGGVLAIWRVASNFAILLQTGRHTDILKTCIKSVGMEEFDYAVVAMQFVCVLMTRDLSVVSPVPGYFLAAVLSGTRMEKLSSAIGRNESNYTISTETEEYCISILTRINLAKDGDAFTFDPTSIYQAVFSRPVIVPQYPDLSVTEVSVKVSDVRAKLRDSFARHHFDLWIDAMRGIGGGPFFDGNRAAWQPANPRVRLFDRPQGRKKGEK